MTAARHAADTQRQAHALHAQLQQLCERSAAGIAPAAEELRAAFQLARITEYHASRTMVAITHASGRMDDNHQLEAAPCL